MKRGVSFAAMLLLSLSVVGCQNGNAGQEQQSTAATKTESASESAVESASETESETEAGTEPETETESEAQNRNTIIGSVEDITMDTLTVLTDNGNEVILPIETAELDFRNGFRVGNLVAIEYSGDIVQKDSTEDDVTVIRVADSADVNEIPAVAGGETEAEEEASSEAESSSEGESESETGSETESESETGTETESEAESESESASQSESETDPESESAAATEAETEVSYQTLTGKVADVTLGEMTITMDDGKELTFKIMNTRMYFAKGMRKGTGVTLSYSGEFDGSNAGDLEIALVHSDLEDAVDESQAQTEEESSTAAEGETETENGSETETGSETQLESETESGSESESE